MYKKGTIVKLLINKENFSSSKSYTIQENLNLLSNVTASHPIILLGENGRTEAFKYYEIISIEELRDLKLKKIL